MADDKKENAQIRVPGSIRQIAAVCFAALLLTGVALRVDLTPTVESDFFFSSTDPQLEATEKIEEIFPSSSQILIQAEGTMSRASYLERVQVLSTELAEVPGVAKVYSLTSGPSSPEAAAESPLWSRLLLSGPESKPRVADSSATSEIALETHSSTLLLQIEEASSSELVAQIETALASSQSSSEMWELQISGVPYVIEMIRRQLGKDLRTFTLAALLIFGIAIAWIYRSVSLVAGTLLSSLCACGATLLCVSSGIGLLTANIATIVFVLTLSHIVFLNANWKRLGDSEHSGRSPAKESSRSGRAIRATFPASFWCMVTTVLGFGSLRLTSARPLQELGMAGATGAVFALAAAYLYYPLFLSSARQPRDHPRSSQGPDSVADRPWLRQRLPLAVALLATLAALATLGLGRLETDPSLLSYFQAGSSLRQGLESLDASGGSSPLTLVLKDPAGGRLDSEANWERLEAIQAAADQDPDVGTALSLPVLLAEAKRAPLARFLAREQLLAILSSPAFDGIARGFVTEDRTQALLFLRMREGQRSGSRQEVVRRLTEMVDSSGLHAPLVGGLYELQGQLSRLVSSSLLAGLGGLTVLFFLIAGFVSRRLRVAVAMGASLLAVPLFIFGVLGHLRLPLDVIASPAANVAIALGIDSMIHLVLRVRRLEREGLSGWLAWVEARRQLLGPVLTALAVIGAGFGIFALSSFPPTRNFGIAVVTGTVAAGALTLIALPFLATKQDSQRRLPTH
ncbi:MAG: MMPL family transporter [Deltaproteobacteria bacterium]|nr:MMPL family transporter [Deltaproteobacteria bacterium]